MTYNKYYPGGWQDDEAGGTPIVAAALETMEDGIGAAHTDLATHAADTTNIHGISSTAALETTTGAQLKVDAHANDTSSAHAASAIAFAPVGSIAATDVQAALAEVAAEAGGSGSLAGLSDATITSPASHEHVVYLSATSKWVNRESPTVWASEYEPIGDGTAHPLSERYATLGSAQSDYPLAGITALTQQIDWAVLQQLVFEFSETALGRRVDLGGYQFYTGSDSLVIGDEAGGDTRTLLHLYGSGRRGARILMSNSEVTNPVVRLTTGTFNIRDTMIENVMLENGAYGLSLNKASYNLFRNVQFSGNKTYAVTMDTSPFNSFDECWWVHITTAEGGCIDALSTSPCYFNDCLFGEDVGEVHINSSRLFFNDCTGHGMASNETPAGYQSMGGAAFTVRGGGELHINGGWWTMHDDQVAFVNADDPRQVNISDARIDLTGTSHLRLLAVRNTDSYFHANLTGLTLLMKDNQAIVESVGATDAIKNTVIDNIQIKTTSGSRALINLAEEIINGSNNNYVGTVRVSVAN